MVRKHTGTERGGFVTWVKRAWNAEGDAKDLTDVQALIDRAVSDLTLSEVHLTRCEVMRGLAQQVHENRFCTVFLRLITPLARV